MCDLEVMGVPSTLRIIRKTTDLVTGQPWTLDGQSKLRGGSGRIHWKDTQDEQAKLFESLL